MKNKDQQLLEEAYGKVRGNKPSLTPVTSKYIYFADDKEMYRVDPYKLILPNDPEMKGISSDKADWNDVYVAVGADVKELGLGEEQEIINDQWYIVDNSFPMDHKSRALVSKA